MEESGTAGMINSSKFHWVLPQMLLHTNKKLPFTNGTNTSKWNCFCKSWKPTCANCFTSALQSCYQPIHSEHTQTQYSICAIKSTLYLFLPTLRRKMELQRGSIPKSFMNPYLNPFQKMHLKYSFPLATKYSLPIAQTFNLKTFSALQELRKASASC